MRTTVTLDADVERLLKDDALIARMIKVARFRGVRWHNPLARRPRS